MYLHLLPVGKGLGGHVEPGGAVVVAEMCKSINSILRT